MWKFDVNEMIECFLWYCAVALALWVSASCSDGWALHWSCCVDLLSLAQTSSKSAILNFGEYCWERCFFPKYILSKWYFWWQNVIIDFSVCKLCFFEKISTKVRKILLPFFLLVSLFLMQKNKFPWNHFNLNTSDQGFLYFLWTRPDPGLSSTFWTDCLSSGNFRWENLNSCSVCVFLFVSLWDQG